MKTVETAYKSVLNVGIVLAIITTICSYAKIAAPIPYLADSIRMILIVAGLGFSTALVFVYTKMQAETEVNEFKQLASKIFGLFVFYVILDMIAQNIVLNHSTNF